MDRGWGKAIEHHMLSDMQGSPLTKVVHEIVHLAPMQREELLVEWKDVSEGNGHDKEGNGHANE